MALPELSVSAVPEPANEPPGPVFGAANVTGTPPSPLGPSLSCTWSGGLNTEPTVACAPAGVAGEYRVEDREPAGRQQPATHGRGVGGHRRALQGDARRRARAGGDHGDRAAAGGRLVAAESAVGGGRAAAQHGQATAR